MDEPRTYPEWSAAIVAPAPEYTDASPSQMARALGLRIHVAPNMGAAVLSRAGKRHAAGYFRAFRLLARLCRRHQIDPAAVVANYSNKGV